MWRCIWGRWGSEGVVWLVIWKGGGDIGLGVITLEDMYD